MANILHCRNNNVTFRFQFINFFYLPQTFQTLEGIWKLGVGEEERVEGFSSETTREK
jgi:hypothetical protein